MQIYLETLSHTVNFEHIFGWEKERCQLLLYSYDFMKYLYFYILFASLKKDGECNYSLGSGRNRYRRH